MSSSRDSIWSERRLRAIKTSSARSSETIGQVSVQPETSRENGQTGIDLLFQNVVNTMDVASDSSRER